MPETTLKLSDSEKEILSEELESHLSDLGMEITDTDSMEYREKLKAKRTVIQKILKELRQLIGRLKLIIRYCIKIQLPQLNRFLCSYLQCFS